MGRTRKSKHKVFVITEILQIAFLVGAFIFLFVQNIYVALAASIAIVFSVYILKFLFRYLRYKRYLASGIDIVDKMDGVEFEEFLLAHFRALKYNASLTQTTNDYGADLVLEKDGIKTLVQAKRWKQKVGLKAVQEVSTARGYYKAQKGIVITNNYCSENARVLANANGIEIWNRDMLQEMMLKNNGKSYAEHIKSKEHHNTDTCPLCTAPLVVKDGKYGAFLGCSAFPDCSYTRKK